MNWLTAIGRLFANSPAAVGSAWLDRRAAYDLYDSYYHNRIYETIINGGQRENINAALGNASAADLAGLYNPVAMVADLYLNVFAGRFGQEIAVETANAALVEPLERIWRWSNLTIEKQPLCRLAATHGTVGLRIVARNDTDPTKRRVYIKPEHPRIIRDVELDGRGNVEAIELEYSHTVGIGDSAETITVREVMDKQEIRTYRVDQTTLHPYDLATNTDNGPRWRYPNDLGVVPYVLLRHTYTGDTWGYNAFYRAMTPIDRLNALLSHVDVQIHRHVRAKWLVAASGSPPEEFDFGDLTALYVDTRNATGTPLVQPMVAPLDLGGAIAQTQLQLSIIEDMLPELKALAGKYLAGQSGETIAQLRKPAEDAVRLARSNYEDAVLRSQQIALSWGVLLELWDLGSGMGSREAADRAYQTGLEDHTFNERPIFGDVLPAVRPVAVARAIEEVAV